MLAKVQGLFRLTRDAELRYGTNGNAILKLGLACSEKFGDKETQLFLDAVAFSKPAEIINQYAGQKGTQIFLCGKLQTESWDKDGQRQYKTSMVVESFEFVSKKSENQSQGQGYQQDPTPPNQYNPPQQQVNIDDMDEIIPF